MGIVRVSVRYAKALFQTALENKVLEATKADMETILASIHQFEDLRVLLHNPVVKSGEKKKAFDLIFGKRIQNLSLRFLHLVVEKKREATLEDICRNFLNLYRREKGIKIAVLTTVVPIEESVRKSLIGWMEKEFLTKIELVEETNPGLRGGFLLRVEDLQLDMSVSTRLREMRKQLISTEFEKKY